MSKGFKIFALAAAAATVLACGGGGLGRNDNSGGGGGNPTLTSINPTTAQVGSPAFTLNVKGSNLLSGVQVLWNGEAKPTQEIDSNTLTAQIPASDLDQGGVFPVRLRNPGGEVSNAINFTVGNPNPTPTITALTPNSRAAGSAGFILVVDGTNFVQGNNQGLQSSEVLWNGTPLETNVASATQLSATVPANLIAAAGQAQVTVRNPAPGGGTSNALVFTIN